MFAWFFVSALYLRLVLGYSAMQVGLPSANPYLAAFSLGLSAKMAMRFGRVPLAAGLALPRRDSRSSLWRRSTAASPPRAPRHDIARHRLRHGHEPGAARRHDDVPQSESASPRESSTPRHAGALASRSSPASAARTGCSLGERIRSPRSTRVHIAFAIGAVFAAAAFAQRGAASLGAAGGGRSVGRLPTPPEKCKPRRDPR
jgi:hypothetical protein